MATTTNASRSRAWMVDVMRPYLVDRLNSTEEEIEVLKHLYSLKSTSNNMRGPRKPSTIIDNFLYHGDFGHAQNKLLLDELGIKHIINVSDQQLNQDIHRDYRVTWINIGDTMDTNISQYFDSINKILYKCANDQEKVLVNCQMGISRSSTIVLSYLLTYHFSTLAEAYQYLLQCRRIAAPNLNFLLQLIRYSLSLDVNRSISKLLDSFVSP